MKTNLFSIEASGLLTIERLMNNLVQELTSYTDLAAKKGSGVIEAIDKDFKANYPEVVWHWKFDKNNDNGQVVVTGYKGKPPGAPGDSFHMRLLKFAVMMKRGH